MNLHETVTSKFFLLMVSKTVDMTLIARPRYSDRTISCSRRITDKLTMGALTRFSTAAFFFGVAM